MERSVVVGGSLVIVSLLLAVLLNSYASCEAKHFGEAHPAQPHPADTSVSPQSHVPRTGLPTRAAPSAGETEVSTGPLAKDSRSIHARGSH